MKIHLKGIPSLDVLILSALIIGIAPWARKILRFIYSQIGKETVSLLLKLFLAGFLIFLFFYIFSIRKRLNIFSISFLLLTAIPFTFLFFRIKLPEERVHLFEYLLLGILLFKNYFDKRIDLFQSIFFILFVGLLDEIFQLFLPQRVFDFRDVFLNVIGGFTGWVCGFSILKKNERR